MNAPVLRYHPAGFASTPLHLAATHGMGDAARLLLARGARPDAVDSAGRTPIEEARRHGRWAMVSLLLEHSPQEPGVCS